MKIACIQLNSFDDMAANIVNVGAWVAKAAAQGAELIATPENVFLMTGPHMPFKSPHPDPLPEGEGRGQYMQDTHPGVSAARGWAVQYRVWILLGSVAVIPSVAEGSKDPSTTLRCAQDDKKKLYNRSLLINPAGEIAAHYDKIHLFDVTLANGEAYAESARYLGGERAVVASITPSLTLPHQGGGEIKLGMTVCYDVRFPHLYRSLAKQGAQILAVPSAFTQTTGEAHWHVLLRARAIENGCFVIAPAQTGTHPGNRKTFGHALIVDPWGKILADAGTQEGIITADIDLNLVAQTRARLPSLEHDREFS